MTAGRTTDTPGQQSLYAERAEEFHSLVSGALRDADAIEHYERLVRKHGVGGAIVDVGCGTGDVINNLSATLETTRLVGVDVVDDMLNIGRREADASRSTAGVTKPEFLRADMHRVTDDQPDLGQSFDLVISRWTYHNSRELTRIFHVSRSLLKPGGWHVFLSNVVQTARDPCPIDSYEVELAEDFSVANYALTLSDYTKALAANRFMSAEVALYSADHKIVKQPRDDWSGSDGFPDVFVFTGVFAAQRMA
ncbi:MAG: class I SAM-dependent methyltransferase [Pseudomonadota bacterium]